MFQELFFLRRLYDPHIVINLPLPYSWRMFSCVNGLDFKVLYIEVDHNGADWRPHECFLDLFKEPALKWEIGGLQAELQ